MIYSIATIFEEFNDIDNKDQPLFATRNLSQSCNKINKCTFIRIFKFKKFLDENIPIESSSIDFNIMEFTQKINYKIILIPSINSSLSVKVEFSHANISNCFVNIQLSVHSKLKEIFTSSYEEKHSLSLPFFIKSDYITYDKQMLDLKMLNPLIIRVRVYQYKTTKLCHNLLGLINEGNTCYMNSILQNIVQIPLIYNRILEIPSKDDNHLFSFQKLIYYLRQSNNTGIKFSDYISNTSFLGQFKFNNQQDVQEIYLYLFEYLVNKEKEYYGESLLSKLFQGSIQSDIKCDEKNYSSSVKESFIFLSLNINNCSTLYSCVEKYLQIEKLTEDNLLQINNQKYEAMKSISFKSLPNIIMIHLKRFSLNNKLTQEVIYPNELDLEGYYKTDSSYLLYSVIVHEGTLNNGHYFIYIKQFKEDKWIKFNDNIVSYSNEKEVFDDNYGGYSDWIEVSNEGELFYYSKDIERTAYILTYIDKSYVSEAFCDISVSKDFVNRIYNLSNQKTLLDYVYQPKPPVKPPIEDDITIQIRQERNSSHSNDNLTPVSVDVFNNDSKKTNKKKVYFDLNKPIYSLSFINAIVSLEHNHSNCRIAKVNAFNMFICFADNVKEDLKPFLDKTNNPQTAIKLLIINDIHKTTIIFIIQRYSFYKPNSKIEIDNIITNENYFISYFYQRNASNLFEVVSSFDEIEKANKFEEIKLKPYQYNKKINKDFEIVRLVMKTMD